MSLTRILPTDRYGRVYYGPRTYEEAQARLDAEWDAIHEEDRDIAYEYAIALQIHRQRLIDAGYPEIAVYN